jgi:hypothetical protein
VFKWHKRFKEAQKVRMQKSRVKIMLSAFFMLKVSFIMNLCRTKQTVNGRFYKEVIERLISRIHRVRPEFGKVGPGMFCTTNAPAHSSGVVSEFLAK